MLAVSSRMLRALTATGAFAGASTTVSGSAYLDYWYLSSEHARAAAMQPVTPEAAIKIEVDVHESVSFSARMCFGCHGIEIDRAHIDFTPSQYFNLQVGRVGVPFGEFSVRYDPTSHRTVSKPLIYEMGRSPDAREGVTSFLEKRPAHFTMRPSRDMPDVYPWWQPRPFKP